MSGSLIGDMGNRLYKAGSEGCQETGLKEKAVVLLDIIRENPFRTPPRFEKLVGDLAGSYSRRITIHHRLIYEVLEKEEIIKVIRMWTHYE